MKKTKTKVKADKLGGKKALDLSKISELYMGFETNEKEEVNDRLDSEKEEVNDNKDSEKEESSEKIELDNIENSEKIEHLEEVNSEKIEHLEEVNSEKIEHLEEVNSEKIVSEVEATYEKSVSEGEVSETAQAIKEIEGLAYVETADQVETTKNIETEEKIAVVTGANSGMGKATVAALADQGFTVIMLCRNLERGELALRELLKKENRKLKLMQCNLGSMNDIRRFTDEFKMSYNKIDVLVNNAGVISLDRRETEDGLEEQFGVNHIGHFLLTLRLLELMSVGSRIVVVSSGAHKVGRIHFEDINLTQRFNVMKAYGQSKLANILFARELAVRLKGKGITVNCCHPGAVATSMGVDRNTGFGKTITSVLKPFFLTPEEGAKTAIFLATSHEVKNITGKYFYQCRMEKTSKSAKSKRLAKKLFKLSEELTKEEMQYEI